jgi:dTDP-4-amino-4,6-dideoxygalactose transaminase
LALKKKIFLATQAREEAPHYQHIEIGYNYRMSNICAGIGRSNGSLDSHIALRRKMHDFMLMYLRILKGCILRPMIRSFQITG